MKIWQIIHKGTGLTVARYRADTQATIDAIIPRVAEEFDYAPWDLMAKEEA